MPRSAPMHRSVLSDSRLPEDLDKDIWEWSPTRAEKPGVRTDFFNKNMSSHVLLAACREDELAWERSFGDNTPRGAFTHCLITQMYKEDLYQLTYSTLLNRLPLLKNQHPICEGMNKNRILFNGAAR